MGLLTDALRRWQRFQPWFNEKCCSSAHFIENKPVGDEYVCPREKAWREYVRLRDSDPEWLQSNLRGFFKEETLHPGKM